MGDDAEVNPFASPSAEEPLVETPPQAAERGTRKLVIAWCFAWLLNMPVPAIFGWGGTSGGGRVGMFAGILALMSLGSVATHRWSSFGKPLVVGGFLFSLTQFYPVIQIWCGILTQVLMDSLGFDPSIGSGMEGDGGLGFAGGLLATLICGGMLLACCCTIALVIWLVLARR